MPKKHTNQLPYREALLFKDTDLNQNEAVVLGYANCPMGSYQTRIGKKLFPQYSKSEEMIVSRAVKRLMKYRYLRQYTKEDNQYDVLKYKIKENWKEGTPILRINLFRAYVSLFPEVYSRMTDEELVLLDNSFQLIEPVLIYVSTIGVKQMQPEIEAKAKDKRLQWTTQDQIITMTSEIVHARWKIMEEFRKLTEAINKTSKPKRLKPVKPVADYFTEAEIKQGAVALSVFVDLVTTFNTLSSRVLNGKLPHDEADTLFMEKKQKFLAKLK